MVKPNHAVPQIASAIATALRGLAAYLEFSFLSGHRTLPTYSRPGPLHGQMESITIGRTRILQVTRLSIWTTPCRGFPDTKPQGAPPSAVSGVERTVGPYPAPQRGARLRPRVDGLTDGLRVGPKWTILDRIELKSWRRLRESNPGSRFCRPLPYHLAKSPRPEFIVPAVVPLALDRGPTRLHSADGREPQWSLPWPVAA